jgi:hypothetical protein
MRSVRHGDPDVSRTLFTAHLRVGNILSPVCKNYVEFFSPVCKNYLDLNRGKLKSTMAHLIAINWTQVMEIVRTHFSLIWSHVLQFLYAHQDALIAPLLWFLMSTVVLCWLPKLTSTPPEPDPKEKSTSRQRRALKQHYRKVTCQANATHVGSIRSHGLHRK